MGTKALTLEHKKMSKSTGEMKLGADWMVNGKSSKSNNVIIKDDKYDTLIRDLHDTLQQTLLVLNMKLRKAKHHFPAEQDSQLLDESISYSQQALSQMKKILSGEEDQAPSTLYEELYTMVEDLASAVDFSITIENKLKGDFPKEKAAHVVKAINEILCNAIKYSNANQVLITLSDNKEKVFVSIQDDGVGFDKNKIIEGHGLKNIRHRIKELGGRVHIDSREGKGTSIRMSVTR